MTTFYKVKRLSGMGCFKHLWSFILGSITTIILASDISDQSSITTKSFDSLASDRFTTTDTERGWFVHGKRLQGARSKLECLVWCRLHAGCTAFMFDDKQTSECWSNESSNDIIYDPSGVQIYSLILGKECL